MATISCRPTRPTLSQRLLTLLAVIDRAASWWGAHRAWPANDPTRIDDRRH